MRLVLLAGYLALASGVSAAVTTVDLTLHDQARNREIPLKVYVPQGPGPFPVIVFSHGAGGSKDGYAYLGSYWAEHGYISLHPTHLRSDHSLIKKHRPLLNYLALKKMVGAEKNFEDRPQDITFILDHLPEVLVAVPALKGKLDATRIGVGGHSFGAYTSIAVAGAVVNLEGKDHKFGDLRPRAFLAISPQGPGRAGFSEDSWSAITRPVFIMTGTKDQGLDGSPWTQRRKAYEGLPAGGKVLAVLTDATHMDFAAGKGRHTEAVQALVQQLSLAWWDLTLKGQASARERLLSGLPAANAAAVHIENK